MTYNPNPQDQGWVTCRGGGTMREPILTAEMLRKAGACERPVAIFEAEWPDGAEVTLANAERAEELDLNRFYGRLLFTPGALKAYIAIDRPAWKAYLAIEQPAWKAYLTIDPPARDAYYSIERPAWDAYVAIERPAWVAALRESLEAQS